MLPLYIYYTIYAALLCCEIMLKQYRESRMDDRKCSHHGTASPYSFSYFRILFVFPTVFIWLSDFFVLVVIWFAHNAFDSRRHIRTTSWFFHMRFERWTNPDTIWNVTIFLYNNKKKMEIMADTYLRRWDPTKKNKKSIVCLDHFHLMMDTTIPKNRIWFHRKSRASTYVKARNIIYGHIPFKRPPTHILAHVPRSQFDRLYITAQDMVAAFVHHPA